MAMRLFRIRSIKRQIVGFGVLLIIFTSLLISTVYTAILWHSLKSQQAASMQRMMNTRTQWIDQWFGDRMKTVRKLAALASVREHDTATMDRDFKALNDLDPYIASIGFLTTEGLLEVTTSGQSGPNLSSRDYFQEAIHGKEHIGKITAGRDPVKEPVIVFATPVYGDDGRIIGVLRASAKMTTINDVMRTMRFGQSGEIYLVDAQGFMLTETRFASEALARNPVTAAVKVDTLGFREAKAGQTGVASYEDYRGKKVVGAFQWLPEKNWAIIAEVDESELIGYILDDLALNFLVIAVILVLSLPAAFVFSRHITKPIVELSNGVRQLREGDYSYRIPAISTPDYAQSEFHELCETFNHMADTIEHNTTELETRVRDRTAALAFEAAEHRRMQERYQILFNSVNDSVFVYSITDGKPGRFSEVNDVACFRLGYSKNELLNFSLSDISSRPDAELRRSFEDLATEGSTLIETGYQTKDAGEIPVEVNSRIFKLGDELLAISTARDITERLEMQQAQRQARHEAENARAIIAKAQRMASLGIMAGNIAHEINQPLNTIKIAASGLAYFQQANIPVAKEYLSQELERIVQETDRISRIVTKTRKLVRMDTAVTAPLISVNRTIDSAITLVEDQQIYKGIHIERNLSPGEALIACDTHQLEQIIVNLLNNAAQALQTVKRRDKIITVAASLSDDKTHITVSDNGPGIEPDSLQHIFEPFFSTNTRKDNMGLGLTIVHSIVSAYRGKVTAENNPDGGASFRLIFPAAKPTDQNGGKSA